MAEISLNLNAPNLPIVVVCFDSVLFSIAVSWRQTVLRRRSNAKHLAQIIFETSKLEDLYSNEWFYLSLKI